MPNINKMYIYDDKTEYQQDSGVCHISTVIPDDHKIMTTIKI